MQTSMNQWYSELWNYSEKENLALSSHGIFLNSNDYRLLSIQGRCLALWTCSLFFLFFSSLRYNLQNVQCFDMHIRCEIIATVKLINTFLLIHSEIMSRIYDWCLIFCGIVWHWLKIEKIIFEQVGHFICQSKEK